jgi:hypothetical protein
MKRLGSLKIGTSAMTGSGHFNGRIESAIVDMRKQSTKAFYQFFNDYGFFDVADTNSPLTDQQRSQVPEYDRHRITDLCNAIGDCIAWSLGDENKGILTNEVEAQNSKLDAGASATRGGTRAQVMAESVLSMMPVVPGPVAGAAAQVNNVMENLNLLASGLSMFHPDILPVISIGLPSIPQALANLYSLGKFKPNWNFLFDQAVKTPGFYINGDGKPAIGAEICLRMSEERNDVLLGKIFQVPSFGADGQPVGDVINGFKPEEFEIISKVSLCNTQEEIDAIEGAKDFALSGPQMQNTHFFYMDLLVWNVIKNHRDWPYGHWGCLASNSMPEPIKTALASYLYTEGMAIDPDRNPSAGFISYLATMGLYYSIGFKGSVKLWALKNFTKVRNEDGSTTTLNFSGDYVARFGVPEDKNQATRYFTWIADTLARLTYEFTSPELAKKLRERRIAEANQIFAFVGYPQVSYGMKIGKLNLLHASEALYLRDYHRITKAIFYRYPNEGAPGGEGLFGELKLPEKKNLKIEYASGDLAGKIPENPLKFVEKLCYGAGVSKIKIVSTNITLETQANLMFMAMDRPAPVFYFGEGANICQIYLDYCRDNFNAQSMKYSDYVTPDGGLWVRNPITLPQDNPDYAKHKNAVLSAMVNALKACKDISRINSNCANPDTTSIVNIDPNSIKPKSRKEALRLSCVQALKSQQLQGFSAPAPLGPGDSKNFHLEIDVNIDGEVSINANPPSVQMTLTDPFLKNPSSWDVPFQLDRARTVADG